MNRTTKPKGIGIAATMLLATLLVTMSFAPGVTSAYDEPDEHWEDDNSARAHTGGEWINAYIAGSVGCFNASTWIPGRDVWEYNFRITGVGAVRDDGGNPEDFCRCQVVQVQETVNKEHQVIWTSTDKRYIGAWPHSGTNAEYYDVAYAATSFAISAISSHASFALSAAGLVAAFVNACDDKRDGETVLRQWDYSPDQTDVGHWFWWIHDVDPNQEVEFTVDGYLYGPGYEGVSVDWEFTCPAIPTPGKMSAAEMEKYGIEVIPISELKGRADDLRLVPETVEELLKQGEPIYRAHNVSVVATSHQPEPPVLPPPGKIMSAAEMEKYGIEVIPISELKGRADDLGLAPETVEELLKQGEPVYCAHNVSVVATSHQPEPPVFLPQILEKLGEK